MTSCSACTTSPGRRRRSSSTSASTRAATRWRCSGARASRASASCPTCSPSRRGASTGSSSRTERRAAAMSDLPQLEEGVLAEWLVQQRWFGAKASQISHFTVLDAVPLRTGEAPVLAAALLEARFPAGTHELYQVLLGARPVSEGWSEGVIGEAGGWALFDALGDPEGAARLGGLLAGGAGVTGGAGGGGLFPAGGGPPAGGGRGMG